jgi:hypothetical protein
VRPTAALNRLEEVLVILKKEERDPTSTAANARAADILAERLPSVPDKPPAPTNAAGAPTAGHAVPVPRVAHVQPLTASSEIPGQVKSTAAPVPGVANAPSAPASNPAGGPVGTKAATTPTTQTSKPAPKQPAPATPKPVADSPSTQPQPSNPGDTPQ